MTTHLLTDHDGHRIQMEKDASYFYEGEWKGAEYVVFTQTGMSEPFDDARFSCLDCNEDDLYNDLEDWRVK